MGDALKRLSYDRSDYVLTTKVFFGEHGPDSVLNQRGLSRKHVVEGLRKSLKRLQVDYVDVVFAHRSDPDVSIEEVVRAFNWVIEQGWAFYWGTSEWTAAEITEAWDVADRLNLIGPCAEQPQYNLLHRSRVEDEYAPLYKRCNLGLTIWSPLAFGMLTGKYSGAKIPEDSRLIKEKRLADSLTVEKANAVDNLKPIARRLGTSLAQLALAWCLKNKQVSVVLMGASKLEQVRALRGEGRGQA